MQFLYLGYLIVQFQNGCNKVAIELWVLQFWSILNQNHAACSFDFEITRMISDHIALHSVQLPLWTQSFYGVLVDVGTAQANNRAMKLKVNNLV